MPSTLRELADRCHFTLGAATLSDRNFLANTADQHLHTQHFSGIRLAEAIRALRKLVRVEQP